MKDIPGKPKHAVLHSAKIKDYFVLYSQVDISQLNSLDQRNSMSTSLLLFFTNSDFQRYVAPGTPLYIPDLTVCRVRVTIIDDRGNNYLVMV
jgi:hypothetical protein